jgi:hypothetical protein
VVDGRPHTVVDSVNLGNTIETVSRWENGNLLITSTLLGRPNTQTISLNQDQLVIVNTYLSYPDARLTLRYTKEK